MFGFLVAERVGALWLVQNKQKRSGFGLYVGSGPAAVFIPASDQLLRVIPEECWDFGNERVYANPIAVERQTDGQLALSFEREDSHTRQQALVLLQVRLPRVDQTRFELSEERILARAMTGEDMLVAMLPGESIKAVGYLSGLPFNYCLISYDGKDVKRTAVMDCRNESPNAAA